MPDDATPPSDPATSDTAAVRWRRLRAQRLLEPAERVEDAVEGCAGITGALPSGLLALAARGKALTPGALDKALHRDRTLLRVPAMRGAVYLMPKARLAEALALADAPRVWRTLFQAGVAEARCEAIAAAVLDALAERPRTGQGLRRALAPVLAREPLPQGGFNLLLRAMSHEGRIVRTEAKGGVRSQAFAYARGDDWLGGLPAPLPRQEALARLLPWYLEAHGPATARDFAWWAGAPLGEAEAALAQAEARREVVAWGGGHREAGSQAAYLTRAGMDALAEVPERWSHAALVPHWDAWLMGHADRAAWVEARWLPLVVDPQGNPTNLLLAQGLVAGVWGEATKGQLRVARFGRTPPIRDVAQAGAGLTAVLGPRTIVEVPRPRALAELGQNAFRAPLSAPARVVPGAVPDPARAARSKPAADAPTRPARKRSVSAKAAATTKRVAAAKRKAPARASAKTKKGTKRSGKSTRKAGTAKTKPKRAGKGTRKNA